MRTLLTGFALATTVGLFPAAGSASSLPSWVRVETITVDGVANAIPGGATIHRVYAGGTYRFSLDPTSPGISYSGGRPPEISSFLMIIDKSTTQNSTQTVGLSEDVGPTYTIETSGAGFSLDAFVADIYIGDNSGSTRIFVDQWK